MLLVVGLLLPPAWTPQVVLPLTTSGRSSVFMSDVCLESRRAVLRHAASTAGIAPILGALPTNAALKDRPVLVLGASGGTGRECVKYLLSCNRPCIAATRSGSFEFDGATGSSLLTVAKGDVTDPTSIAQLITPNSLSGVIYAASASRQPDAKATSNAKAVDKDGVVTCAKLCIASDVSRLVLVSSGGVSKPTSAVYLFLNVAAGGIMDAKISGEDQLRALYAAPGVAKRGVGYTVVRPGGLTYEPPLGVGALELNQGDTKSGRIARSDVAAICVESLYSAAAFDTTFECYNGDTAKELNAVFASNARGMASGDASGAKDPTQPTMLTGTERRGNSWPQLFEGLQKDLSA